MVKISSNTRTYQCMKDFIDIDAGKTIKGVQVDTVVNEIFEFLIQVCNGERTAAETNVLRQRLC